jgi:outer membrane protein OmpA-like peptidoglycan-associated protein
MASLPANRISCSASTYGDAVNDRRYWWRPLRLVLVILIAVGGACGGDDDADEPTGEGDDSVTTVGDTTRPPAGDDYGAPSDDDSDDDSDTTLPEGAIAGLDDYNGDGEPDPTCGNQDFGAGLVLRIPCGETGASNTPENGTTLVENSMYRLPGSTDVDLTGISGQLVLARDVDGIKVVIVVFNSDNLFETGSADVGSTDTMDNTISLINRLYAGSAIQVRGHTDSVGSPGSNQTLSERRADAVRVYMLEHGVQASGITSVGLASTQPLVLETNPDGSPNPDGRKFNRRVEIVLRVP